MIKKDKQRLFDLVRYCRAELHQDGLITDDEYAEVLTERGSVERLTKYDTLVAENKRLRAREARTPPPKGGSFQKHMHAFCNDVHAWAVLEGWWDTPRNDGEIIALIHSELSEALETLRTNPKPSEHIPAFSGMEEEMADVVIRVADYCRARGLNLGGAIVAKMRFNDTRAYRHGKKF